ncbi:2-oxo acid dehydrogenase subunit E2 [bacterium]|nr:MAG: 2-oxo acid dehydrogenase subunit E2 [bacterium]
MATQVIMPQLGESVVEGTVAQWFKHEGEKIDEFESLLEVDTDKVNSEIPSPAAGVVLKIVVPEGQTVPAGTVLAWIGQPGESIAGAAPAPVAPPQATATPPAPAPASAGRDRDLGFISPVVAKLAREHNLDLATIKGSGEGGRITKKDVLAHLESAPGGTPAQAQPEPAAWETPGEGDLFRPTEMMFGGTGTPSAPAAIPPAQAPSAPARAATPPLAGEGRLVPLSPIRKRIAEHMVFSRHTSPHVTSVMEVDLKNVVAHREANKPLFARDGVNLTYTAYFMAATALALRTYPLVNASWREEGVWIHNDVNIGMATSLGEEGLIVPVIQQADGLSLLGLARAINDLAARARGHRLKPDEVQGGTFTITNHGTGGSLFAMPIINQPQCAILGVGAIQKRVVVLENDAIAVRPMVYLSLTFDHRILDGDYADKFLSKIVSALQNWS